MSPPEKTTTKRGRSEDPAPDGSNKRLRTENTSSTPSRQQHQANRDTSGTDGPHTLNAGSAYPTSFPHTGVPAALAGFRAHLAQQPSNPSVHIGGVFTLDDAKLQIPSGLSPAENRKRCAAMVAEAKYQEQHPPVLPASKIEPVAPKEPIEEFFDFPDDIDAVERERRVQRNNEIAGKLQRIDRERNNQAAKRSRQSRLEALTNTRILLNEKTAECAWFRLKFTTMGGSTKSWDEVPEEVKAAMVREIAERVNLIDREKIEQKKRLESERRVERNKARQEEKARQAAASASPMPALDLSFPEGNEPIDFYRFFPDMSVDVIEHPSMASDLGLPNPDGYTTNVLGDDQNETSFTTQLQNLSHEYHLPSQGGDTDTVTQQPHMAPQQGNRQPGSSLQLPDPSSPPLSQEPQ